MDREVLDRLIADLTSLKQSLAAPAPHTGFEVDRSEWLPGLLAHSPDVIAILDLEGRIVYLSRTTGESDPKALHGRFAADFIPVPYRERWLEALSRALTSKQAQHLELLSNMALWWETRIIPIERNGAVTYLLSIGKDVTPQKRAEAELAVRDAQLRLALEASGMGQWSWNVENDLVTLDPAAQRVFSWP